MISMKKRICLALSLAAFAWSACNNNDDKSTPGINVADRSFITDAANANQNEIALGRLAISNARGNTDTTNNESKDSVKEDRVKMFAQMMIDDHTEAMNELQSIANTYGVTLPSTLDRKHDQLVQELTSMKGMTFDTAYIKSQIQDHQNAISFFESEINYGTSQQVVSYANKYLPAIKMHLQRADSIAKILSDTTNNSNDSTNMPPPH
jgi:putative membrane protein